MARIEGKGKGHSARGENCLQSGSKRKLIGGRYFRIRFRKAVKVRTGKASIDLITTGMPA